MDNLHQSRDVPQPRCGNCGYRRDAATLRCSECGDEDPPIGRAQRNEANTLLRRWLWRAAIGWLVILSLAWLPHLAVALNSFDLFMLGLVAVAFFVPAAGVGWAIFTSVEVTPKLLVWIWSMRDGETGPWSGWPTVAALCVPTFLLQIAFGALVYWLAIALLPGYPGGWP